MRKSKKLVYCSVLAAGLGVLAEQVETQAAEMVSSKNSELVSKVKNSVKQRKVELYQSESFSPYKNNILKNDFGFSDAQSTGVYKRAGDTITITIDPQTDQTTLPTYTITPISLTNHTQGNATGIALKKGVNVISGNTEGIIHLRNISDVTKKGSLNVTIDGGVHIPRFILGKTTNKEWQEQLAEAKKDKVYGYELVGRNTIVTGSEKTINLIKNPEEILKHHDAVTDLHNQSHGLDNSSELHRTSRGLVQHMRETSSSGTWMYAFTRHTAYHVNAMIRVLQPDTEDQWGIYHEMGHTYQMKPMTWKDMTEVTVNIYSLRAEKAAGKRSRLEKDRVYSEVFKLLEKGNFDYNSKELEDEFFVKLAMFWQLELAFGEDFYPNLHKLYREENAPLNWNDDQKIQYFIKSTSKIANTNLTPFFEKWGLKVSSGTQNELKQLPNLTKKIWQYRDEMTGEVEDIETNEEATAVTAPSGLQLMGVTTNSIYFRWTAVSHPQGIREYQIFRDGKLVGTSQKAEYIDKNLASDTAYTYQVKAVSNTGQISEASNVLNARTQKSKVELPTIPAGLQFMGRTTNSIYFRWTASSHSQGIKEYQIFREGKLVGTSQKAEYIDTNLTSGTEYTYYVKAVSNDDEVSEASSTLKAATKKEEIVPENPSNPSGVKEWDANTVYVKGDQVNYNGIVYTAKYWTKGNQPDASDAWETDAVLEWNSTKAYNGGDKVTYKRKIYTAKWWTRGEQPDQSSVWVSN